MPSKRNLKPYILAFIGLLGTILAPIVTTWYQHRLQTKDLLDISRERENSIEGYWVGNNVQSLGNDTINVPLKMHLIVQGKKLVGEIEIDWKDLRESEKHFELNGGFYDSHFLKIEYLNKNPGIIQFGAYLLELSPDSRRLTGKFVGYGSKSERILTGDVRYQKQD